MTVVNQPRQNRKCGARMRLALEGGAGGRAAKEPVMPTTTDAPCERGCPWPARECDQCEPEPAAYAVPIALFWGVTALGYVAFGAACVFFARLAWSAARAVAGYP